ncbi:MAG: YybH family protein [Gemmatimonadales bacterium]
MRCFVLLLVVVLTACRAGVRPAAAPSPASDSVLTRQISDQLARGAADWNRGDLDAFLSDYAPESTTTYVDGFRPRRGMDFLRKHYSRYFSPGTRRDSLRFEEIETRPLGPGFALVTARFILERGAEVTASGPFTLVMGRRPEGWRILHDHSSSDPR